MLSCIAGTKGIYLTLKVTSFHVSSRDVFALLCELPVHLTMKPGCFMQLSLA